MTLQMGSNSVFLNLSKDALKMYQQRLTPTMRHVLSLRFLSVISIGRFVPDISYFLTRNFVPYPALLSSSPSSESEALTTSELLRASWK